MSLQITNFSLDVGDHSLTTSGISVDITDSVHTVTTLGCYFSVDSTIVDSTSFTPISNGYRMTYDPADDFSSLSGGTEFRVYGRNDNNDVLYQNFYLTYGYIVSMSNRPQDGWNFGYDTEVVVRASAENNASCPISNAEAFLFETESRPNKYLGASITGIPEKYTHSSGNISATIYPQSTAFFYGKTYRVVLRASDLAGNVMPPYEFEFTIEDKP